MGKFHIVLTIFAIATVARGIRNENKNSYSKQEGMLEKISRGVKMAGQYLGMETSTADTVSKLVSAAFNAGKKPDKNENGFFSGVLKLFAFDYSKIAAIPLNAIVFLAQIISTTLLQLRKPQQLSNSSTGSRQAAFMSPLDWIQENPSNSLASLKTAAKNQNLPQEIIENIREHSGDDDTSCVQLLVCKSAPFIWKMQSAIFDTKRDENSKKKNVLYRYLPDMKAFQEHGEECESKYASCRIIS